MLTTALIHPRILGALAGAGHGSRILVSDANFPHSTGVRPELETVHLNLVPGTVDAVTVLRALLTAIRVESAWVMRPEAPAPRIEAHEDFERELGDVHIEGLSRGDFYAEARGPAVGLQIATGETRLFANLLLTVGAIPG